MNSPLDDFNRRTTAGNGSWTMGPPTNAAESAAQSMIDAQQRGAGPTGGGSIDFGVRPCAVLLLIGLALFAGGNYAVENLQEGKALMGIAVLILSGFLILIGGGGLVVGVIKTLGSARGWGSLILAAGVGLIAWWLSPMLWSIGLTAPRFLIVPALVAVMLFISGKQR